MPKKPDNIEDILNKFESVIHSKKKDKKLFREIKLGTINSLEGMISKYSKLIAVLEKAGITDFKIPHLKQRLDKLIKNSKFIKEKKQDLLHEHDLKIKENIAQYLEGLDKEVKTAGKDLKEFFEHYTKDFELRNKLEALLVDIQKQLAAAFAQLKEINKKILVVKEKITVIDKKITTIEQQMNDTENLLAKKFDKEWEKFGATSKPNFQKIIHDCIGDKDKVILEMHGLLEQYMIDFAKIEAKQDQVVNRKRELDELEKSLRVCMDDTQDIDNYIKLKDTLTYIKEEKRELALEEQQLEKQEEEIDKKVQKLQQTTLEVKECLQEPKQKSDETEKQTQKQTPLPKVPTPYNNQ